MRKLVLTLVLGAVVAVFVLAGCGGSSTDSAADTQTVTVVETTPAPVQPETVTVVETAPTAPSEPVEQPASDGIEVPDVVGLDHQLAQDTMQAAGLYVLAEQDATGQGRMLLWDRNWTVVSQEPAGGTIVSDDRTITLSSKKDGE